MTLKTHEVVIADTSCLIVLTNAGLLEVLYKLYGNIIITQEVADEYCQELPNWITIIPVIDFKFQLLLTSFIDKGEASAIALAMELDKDTLLILDDQKARKIAENLELNYTGTLGILTLAKKQGIITELKPVIDILIRNGFRVDLRLKAYILHSVNEQP